MHTKNNKNFTFFSADCDIQSLDLIEQTLESEFPRISGDLGNPQADNKITVQIFPDLTSFHSAIGIDNPQPWMIGDARPGLIRIVSPLNPGPKHSAESILQCATHEMAHVLTFFINFEIPLWLSEGIATWEARQKERMDIVYKHLDHNNMPTFDDLNEFPCSYDIYPFSYSIVEFLKATYGFSRILELVADSSSLEKTLGKTLSDIREDWIEYLKKRPRNVSHGHVSINQALFRK